ncbi:PHA/PHB synthase family protein [Candidatus Ichthyocystis sparus]|uniref:PHA/PHB synthase family protein n=1 Tax=Candidatus Ichthyocystis sparus TaxID=1561004 RepID=UPI000A9A99E7|nr:alpha/beta fold hydrolase [Candidatus Ichthyocystis sparus]
MFDKFSFQQREAFFLFSYAVQVFGGLLLPDKNLFIKGNLLPSNVEEMVNDIRDRHMDIWRQIFVNGSSLLYEDHRFYNTLWRSGDYFQYIHQIYLLFCDFISRYRDIIFFNYKFSDTQHYWLDECVSIVNPANYFFTNPVALSAYIKTSGETLCRGFKMLYKDICQIDIGRVPDGCFKVGHNLATTPGNIVLKTDLYELIFYNQPCPKRPPVMIFPPCINKFYILDLQKENSLVQFCISQNYPVFMLSWRSMKPDQADYNLKDYVYALIDCISFVREATGYDKIHVLGYCISGFFLIISLMIMSLNKLDWVCSATLLVSVINSSYSGILGSFVQEGTIDAIKRRTETDPIIYGYELAWIFAFIRSEDLIWSYVRRRYLLGEESKPFDILAWNADHTNITAKMFIEYLELLYMRNVLMSTESFLWEGLHLSGGMISCPIYMVSCLMDNIVPWNSVYFGMSAFPNADIRFVLSSAGHTAGVVSPPNHSKRFYYSENYKLGDRAFSSSGEEILSSPKHSGSWWLDWAEWMHNISSFKRHDVDSSYTHLSEAPGTYVFESSRRMRGAC